MSAVIDERPVHIHAGNVELAGDLAVPPDAHGVVLFAHGSGSSRFSRRNRFVAEQLQHAELATLLIDLLTAEEERIDDETARLRFDIPMLARRLVAAIDWLAREPATANRRVGLFGASTGGGAALIAAAERPHRVAAVVSRGGRPDLADAFLPVVKSPTLLIVGGEDDIVIALNQEAMGRMTCPVELKIIPGATHLFEEPGKLESVAQLAGEWFQKHFP